MSSAMATAVHHLRDSTTAANDAVREVTAAGAHRDVVARLERAVRDLHDAAQLLDPTHQET